MVNNCRELVIGSGVDDRGMSISSSNGEGEFLSSEGDVLRVDSEGHVSGVGNWWWNLVYVGQFVPYLGFRDSRLLCSEDLDSSC
jgi:hypothetical protein